MFGVILDKNKEPSNNIDNYKSRFFVKETTVTKQHRKIKLTKQRGPINGEEGHSQKLITLSKT